MELDTALPEQTYVHQALAKLPEQTIAFGRPIGVTVNYAADRAWVPLTEGDHDNRLQVYIQRIYV